MSSSSVTPSRYRLFEEIAAGGMASVHLGLQAGESGFSRVVAVKRLLPDLAREKDFVDMFVDEARLAARIRHPNVVHIVDVVREEGQLLLVMEYVSGESLSRLLVQSLRAGERLPPDVVSAIVADVLHGLHAAHEATNEKQEPLRIVHRDVSPQNILVGDDGVARVIDFGVAKAVGRLTTTRDGRVKGKAGYMAPEQLRGLPLDRRADVYAAGVVLWEALVGKRLFLGDSPAATMMLVLESSVLAPSQCGAPVSAAVDAVVVKATAKNAEERFATAEEMALALEEALRPASAPAVAAWVRRVAREALAARAALVTSIETGAATPHAAPPSKPELAPSAPAGIPRESVTPNTIVDVPRRRSRWWWFAPVPLLALGALYLVIHPTLTPSATPASSAMATVTAPPAIASHVAVSASASASAALEAPTGAGTTSARAADVPAKPTVATRAVTPRASAAPKAPDCDPPYVIDERGIRVPKKECL